MSALEKVPVLLARPCHYSVPDDLEFQGLALPEGAETVRLRFSRRRGTILDLPLSAEALSNLVQTLAILHGTIPEKMESELSDLRKMGMLRFED